MANPKKPFAAIVGGSKVSSKIGVIESLLEKVDLLFLGGGMIYTFYKAQGHSVGSSLVEEDKLDLATSLIEKAKVKGVKLLLPADVVVADKFAPDANSKVLCHCPFKLCGIPGNSACKTWELLLVTLNNLARFYVGLQKNMLGCTQAHEIGM